MKDKSKLSLIYRRAKHGPEYLQLRELLQCQ